MGVTSDQRLLPTAFDLSKLTGMSVATAAATAGTGSHTSSEVKAGGAGLFSAAANNNNAAVAAAAAIGFDEEEEEEFAESDDLEYEEDLLNNAATSLDNAQESAPSSNFPSGSAASGSQQHRSSAIVQKLAGCDVVVANIHQLPFLKLEAIFPRYAESSPACILLLQVPSLLQPAVSQTFGN